MKNPKDPAIRILGQRQFDASLLTRRTNLLGECRDNPSKKGDMCVSLSDFLDRKLRKAVLYEPITKEETSRPVTTFVGSKCLAESPNEFGNKKKAKEEDKTGGGIEKVVLRQFKQEEKQIREDEQRDVLGRTSLEHLKQNNADRMDHMTPLIIDAEGDTFVKEEKISRKRKDPFEGMDVKDRIRKPVLVLGEKPKGSNPVQKRRLLSSSSSSNKRHTPVYNHYANGSGWWDCDMEGIDSEEVGYGEVWEGVGSTTFGEIVDWH